MEPIMASIGGDLEKKHQLLKILDKRVDFFGSHMRITTGAFFDIWKACCMLNVLTPKEVGDGMAVSAHYLFSWNNRSNAPGIMRRKLVIKEFIGLISTNIDLQLENKKNKESLN